MKRLFIALLLSFTFTAGAANAATYKLTNMWGRDKAHGWIEQNTGRVHVFLKKKTQKSDRWCYAYLYGEKNGTFDYLTARIHVDQANDCLISTASRFKDMGYHSFNVRFYKGHRSTLDGRYDNSLAEFGYKIEEQ